MKNHHEVGHFKNRLMIGLLSLFALCVMAGQSFAATTCSSCHGMPPIDSADGLRHPTSGSFVGNHQTHIRAGAGAAECTKCHANSNYNSTHAATNAFNIKMAASINSSPAGAPYTRGTSFPQSSNPSLGNCSNVNCHFETVTPQWGTSAAGTNCNTCHATPRGASGSHAKHEAAYGGTASCTQCHPNYGTTSFSHATSAGQHKIVTNTFLNYTRTTNESWLPSQTKVYGSCMATACHDAGRGNPRTIAWGSTPSACSACHEKSPTTFSHQKHLTSGMKTIVCADCHKGYVEGTTVTADHIDGNVDVYASSNSGSPNTAADLGYLSNKTKGSAVSSCSASYCHSNGKGQNATIFWGATSTGCDLCHPTLTAGHGKHTFANLTQVSFYNYTGNRSAGALYQFGCGSCHPNSVAKHIDNFVDVDLAPVAIGGSLKQKNLAGATINALKCSNVYCHSNGYDASFKCRTTLAWTDKFDNYTAQAKGKKDRCAWCHGNSPNSSQQPVGSNAHNAHVVGIHYDNIYNGVSRKLPQGGGQFVNAAHGRDNRSTTINCNICHSATVSASANDSNSACSGCHNGTTAPLKGFATISDTSKHLNGKVDVAFIGQKIATKAQLVNSAFIGYTAATAGGWTRNKGIYKTYTSGYDVTKLTLSASASPYTSAAGCLNIACHSSITVKWTDAVTCTSCHTRLK